MTAGSNDGDMSNISHTRRREFNFYLTNRRLNFVPEAHGGETSHKTQIDGYKMLKMAEYV